MRHGRLLAEDSPSRLLSAHAATTLESVFLKLCVQDKSEGSDLNLEQKGKGVVASHDISTK